MNLSDYFSAQARRPSGLFGRIIMPLVFDYGNAYLNGFVAELMALQPDDRVLEIGCGTGKLMQRMARELKSGQIVGVDFSSEMVAIAEKRNRKNISRGTAAVVKADVAASPFSPASYSKACSVNTLYFWQDPDLILKKVMELLAPGGRFVLAFEDTEQLKRRELSADLFRLHTKDDVLRMLSNSGASGEVTIETRKKNRLLFHCAVAIR